MAVTKLWAVKTNLGKVIDYANNPNKTRNPKYTEEQYQALADVLTYAKIDDVELSQAKEKISQITEKLRTLRKEVKLCNGIAERSGLMKEHLEQVLAEEEKSKGKESREYDQRW